MSANNVLPFSTKSDMVIPLWLPTHEHYQLCMLEQIWIHSSDKISFYIFEAGQQKILV